LSVSPVFSFFKNNFFSSRANLSYRQNRSPSIASLCVDALSICESLIHPRAPAIVVIQKKEQIVAPSEANMHTTNIATAESETNWPSKTTSAMVDNAQNEAPNSILVPILFLFNSPVSCYEGRRR
jgi:hypothetical protein